MKKINLNFIKFNYKNTFSIFLLSQIICLDAAVVSINTPNITYIVDGTDTHQNIIDGVALNASNVTLKIGQSGNNGEVSSATSNAVVVNSINATINVADGSKISAANGSAIVVANGAMATTTINNNGLIIAKSNAIEAVAVPPYSLRINNIYNNATGIIDGIVDLYGDDFRVVNSLHNRGQIKSVSLKGLSITGTTNTSPVNNLLGGKIDNITVEQPHVNIINQAGTIGNIDIKSSGYNSELYLLNSNNSFPTVTGNISGSNNQLYLGSGNDNVTFTTSGTIYGFDRISLNSTDPDPNNYKTFCTIKHAISGVSDNSTGLSVDQNSTITITDGGSIDGGGVIINQGTLAVSGDGNIGGSTPMGNVTNSGIMNLGGGNVTVGGFTNNNTNAALNVTNGILKTTGVTNTLGAITISNGDLSSADSATANLTNSAEQIITVLNTGTIGTTKAIGSVTNSGVMNLGGGNVTVGAFTNNNTNAALNVTNGILKTTSVTNTLGAITISNGDLSSADGSTANLTNAAGRTITVSNTGTIGATKAISVTNSGVMNLGGGNVTVGAFTNNNTNAALNVTNGILKTTGVTNTLGAITISNGDLSSADSATANLTNSAGQTITVSNTGTIGTNKAISVTNSGIMNLGGGNVTVGAFTNNNTYAALNVTNGILKTTGVTNTLGAITISNGDLSSADGSTANLTNSAGQTITVSNTGTIGTKNAIGSVTNSGIMNLGGGNVTVGAFTNNHANAILNVTGGTLKTTGISNTLGTITVSNGNLNSTGQVVNNSTINLNGGPITGNITNNGIVNVQKNTVITGSYDSNSSNSTHIVNIAIGKVAPILTVNGNVNIGGNIEIIDTGSSLQIGDSVTILNGTGTHTIVPQYKIFNQAISQAVYSLITQSGNILVKLDSMTKSIWPTFSINSSNPTISVVAQNMSNNTFSDDAKTVFNLIAEETSEADQITAFNQLSPDFNVTQGINQAASFDAGSMVTFAVEGRIDQIARNYNNQDNYFSAKNMQKEISGYSAGGIQSNDAVWIKALGNTMRQKQQDEFVGYNAYSKGFMFGVDTKINDFIVGGVGLSYVNTKVNTKNFVPNKAEVNSFQTTIYGSYSLKKYYLDGLLAFAVNKYTMQRNIIFANRQANAQFSGFQPLIKISSGYVIPINNFKIIPNVSLQYILLHQARYDENNAGGINLINVSSKDLQN
jgi:uncharacterized protein with beta-barrel porin domain